MHAVAMLAGPKSLSGGNSRLALGRLTKDMAAAEYRLDVVLAIGSAGELFAQPADENVDDLGVGLIQSAIELIEECFLGHDTAFAQAKELEDLVLLAGQIESGAADRHQLGVEVDDEVAGLDDGLGVAFGPAHDRVDARHQLILVEGLGQVVVRPEGEAFALVLDAAKAGQDQ